MVDQNKASTSKPNPIMTQWSWLKGYNGSIFADDLVAAIIVTILLVPQSLAYALLAGLPPQVGIYVSIFPLIAYALFGSSRIINVGPTAVISLMTAASIAALPEGTRLVSAAALALMTGGILLLAGLLKAGFIMNFVSRPVVSAYITGAALLIIFSQLKHILGVQASGNTVIALLGELVRNFIVARSTLSCLCTYQAACPKPYCQADRPNGTNLGHNWFYFFERRLKSRKDLRS